MTATPEDLINTVIEADDLRRQSRGQPSTRAASALRRKRPGLHRNYIEPFFNVLGCLWAGFMLGMPSPIRRRLVQWVNCKMGGYSPPHNPDLSRRIAETVRLANELKKKTGQWPAFLVLTSHPDTEGPHQWLRFEILRQGLQMADAVVDAHFPGSLYPAHPRCLLAIDPFALDTVSAPVAGFYSAWMHGIYLAWDRQRSTQSWLQRHYLLPGSDYSRIAWRLLKFLKADVPILMAFGGGLPYNARLLYATREFVHRLPIQPWRIPKRNAQIELMRILMTPEGNIWPADHGELPSGKMKEIREVLLRWGLPAASIDSAVLEFQDEFKLSVPYRERLLHVLLGRLVKKGKPMLLVGVSHSSVPPHVHISEPMSVDSYTDPGPLARSFGRFFSVLK